MLLSGIPRVRLLDGPTPLQHLERIEALTGHGALWVKRDDAMPLGQGGNKLRSLEFWLGEARAQGADIVLVAGQTVSNQCRLTAAAAARLGLECLILHNDDAPAVVQGNHLLARLYGARFRFLGPIDEDARGARVAEAAAELRSAGRRP
jgi:1-aminocyclopropane-1-carboxylate deaminase/D-cysteine desulfhydrase-like pyridoxal-dependent ACC family enzyme